MTARQLVPLAADLGAVLLAAGAEIRAVEVGLYRLFAAHGLEAEAFVLLKGLFLSAWAPGEAPTTLIRHVRGPAGTDLTRLEEAQLLLEEACHPPVDPEALRARIDLLAPARVMPLTILTLAAAATAGIYAVFFGGNALEAAGAAGLGGAAPGFRRLWGRALPPLADVFLASSLLALGSVALAWVGIPVDPGRVMTGAVMVLIPGVALVNGVKDVLHGDTVSSLYRLADAGLQTAAIAGGVALVFAGGWIHG